MFLQDWVNGILINESSVYGTLCIVLLKILNMGLYFSEIDTRGWPYRRQDLLFPFNHSFAQILFILAGNDDIHKSLDEFEIRPDPIRGHRVSCS